MPKKVLTFDRNPNSKALDALKKGDIVIDGDGKRDQVTAVDKYIRKHELHYYIRRQKLITLLFIFPK